MTAQAIPVAEQDEMQWLACKHGYRITKWSRHKTQLENDVLAQDCYMCCQLCTLWALSVRLQMTDVLPNLRSMDDVID